MMSQGQRKVGFIGLGNMGRGIAKNLISVGNDVFVWDVNEAARALILWGSLQVDLSRKAQTEEERTAAEVLAMATEQQVEIVDFRFSDLPGVMQHVSIPAAKLTEAHFEGYYYKPRIDKEILEQHKKGLIVMSGCLASEIPSLLAQDQVGVAQQLHHADAVVGEDLGPPFGLPLAVVCVVAFVFSGHRSIYPTQRVAITKTGRNLEHRPRIHGWHSRPE